MCEIECNAYIAWSCASVSYMRTSDHCLDTLSTVSTSTSTRQHATIVKQRHFHHCFFLISFYFFITQFTLLYFFFFFFQAEDGIRDLTVTGVQTCALPI